MHHLHVHVECGDNTNFTLSQNKTFSRQLPEVSASYMNTGPIRIRIVPLYQLMWGSEEVVGGISHEVDTGGAVEVCKPTGHDGKVCQP